MKTVDFVLNLALAVSFIFAGVAWGALFCFDRRAVADLTNKIMMSDRPISALFERMPILPDRITFDSISPEMIGFGYNNFKMRGMSYSSLSIISYNGIISDIW